MVRGADIDVAITRALQLADRAIERATSGFHAAVDRDQCSGITGHFRRGGFESQAREDAIAALELVRRSAELADPFLHSAASARDDAARAVHSLTEASTAAPRDLRSPLEASVQWLKMFRRSLEPNARAEHAIRSGNGIEWLRAATAPDAPRLDRMVAFSLHAHPGLPQDHPALPFLAHTSSYRYDDVHPAHLALSGDVAGASREVLRAIDGMSSPTLDEVRLATTHLAPEDVASPAGRYWAFRRATWEASDAFPLIVRKFEEIAATPDGELTRYDIRAMAHAFTRLTNTGLHSMVPDVSKLIRSSGKLDESARSALAELRQWAARNQELRAGPALDPVRLQQRVDEVLAKHPNDLTPDDQDFLANLVRTRAQARRVGLSLPFGVDGPADVDGGADAASAAQRELKNLRERQVTSKTFPVVSDPVRRAQVPAAEHPELLRRWAEVVRSTRLDHRQSKEPSIGQRLRLAGELAAELAPPDGSRNVARVKELVTADLARLSGARRDGYGSHPDYGNFERIAMQLDLIARRLETANGAVVVADDPGTVSWSVAP